MAAKLFRLDLYEAIEGKVTFLTEFVFLGTQIYDRFSRFNVRRWHHKNPKENVSINDVKGWMPFILEWNFTFIKRFGVVIIAWQVRDKCVRLQTSHIRTILRHCKFQYPQNHLKVYFDLPLKQCYYLSKLTTPRTRVLLVMSTHQIISPRGDDCGVLSTRHLDWFWN